MSESVQFTVRGPKRWEEQLDALIPFIEASPFASSVGRVTRATVLRIVVEKGLNVLWARAERAAVSEPPPSTPSTPSESAPPAAMLGVLPPSSVPLPNDAV